MPWPSVLHLIVRRLLTAVLVLFGVSLFTFAVLSILPGSAAEALLGADATPEQTARLEAELGLDRPVVERYLEWFARALRGDLGNAIASGQPVSRLLLERWPVTVELVGLAVLFSVGPAIAMALLAARRPGGLFDKTSAVVSMIGLSVPNYVVALLLVLVFSVNVRIFPSIGFTPITDSIVGNIRSMTLPAVALGLSFFAFYARFLRGDLLEQLDGQGYIVSARAKGVGPWGVLLRHAFRNSLFGLLTVVGLNLGALIGNAVIIEQIFALPGIGRLLLQAVNTRDVIVVQAIVLFMAVVTVLANLLVDLAYAVLDPRVRHRAG
jgi:peptide/nickel transport system permease protein